MLDTERTATGRFQPGHSGNPAGRPPGSRNKRTLALEDALAARTEVLVEALVRAACDGKGAALRICFDRLAPPAKGRPVPFALPPLACQADVVAAGAAVVMGMSAGELTPAEALDILGVLDSFKKLLTPAKSAPPADAAASRPSRGLAKTCRSSGSAAGADDDNAEAHDPVPASRVMPGPPRPAGAATSPQPPAPSDSCKSSESEARASQEDAQARGPVPVSRVTPDSPPPAAAAASPQPPAPADSCKPPGSEARASQQNTKVLDPTPAPAPTPAAGPPLREPAETCSLPGSAEAAVVGNAAGHGAAPRPASASSGAFAMWMENITGTADQHRPSARPPPFTSSGDPIADRFYHQARQHAEAGDLPETAVLLLQALEIAPDFASARFAFAVIREKLKDPGSGVVAALRKAEAAADADPRAAGLRAVRLAVAVSGEATWQSYVRAVWRRSAAGRRLC
jgi:hypothetical protein